MQDPQELTQPLLTQATPIAERSSTQRLQSSAWLRLCVAAAVGVPLEVTALGGFLPDPSTWCAAALLASSFVAIGIAGYPYFRGFAYTLRNIVKNPPDMDALISLSCGLAWTYALLLVVLPSLQHERPSLTAYLADPLVTLAILGASHALRDRIERKIMLRTESISQALQQRVPASVQLRDGMWRTLSEIQEGDVIRVAANHFIPVDGMLLSPEATLREMTLESGENSRIDRSQHAVLAAGMLNLTDNIEIRALCKGGESKFNKLLEGLRGSDRAALKLKYGLNRAISAFAPSILLIALTNFLVWNFQVGDLQTAIHSMLGVLFGACPCALALAVPLSLSISRHTALQQNMLIRHQQSLAILPQTTMVVFDKTGTLTSLEVTAVTIFNQVNPQSDVYAPLCRMEQASQHPMARALMRFMYREGVVARGEPLQTVAVRGGVRAAEGEHRYFIGNYEGLVAAGLDIPTSSKESLYFVKGDRVLAVFSLQQTMRPEAVEIIKQLKKQGLEVRLLSGGEEASVRAIAFQAGITQYYANKTPEEKEAIIRGLKRAGHIVAYVGDGLNDIPAAQQSDVSISVDPDVGLSPYADVVIEGLAQLSVFMQLAKDTMQNIRQNLAWSVGYNLVVVVMASLVLPMSGVKLSHSIMGLSMALSSLVVVLNAARMLRGLKELAPEPTGLVRPSFFYSPRPNTFTVEISGAGCNGCRGAIENYFTELGLQDLDVGLRDQEGKIKVTGKSSLTEEQLFEAIDTKLEGSKFQRVTLPIVGLAVV